MRRSLYLKINARDATTAPRGRLRVGTMNDGDGVGAFTAARVGFFLMLACVRHGYLCFEASSDRWRGTCVGLSAWACFSCS